MARLLGVAATGRALDPGRQHRSAGAAAARLVAAQGGERISRAGAAGADSSTIMPRSLATARPSLTAVRGSDSLSGQQLPNGGSPCTTPRIRRIAAFCPCCPVLGLLLVPALAGAALPGSQKKPFQQAPSLKERVKGNPKTGTGKAGGKFRLTYAPVKDQDYREVRDIFKEAGLLEEAVQGLNETFRIPKDVEVTLRECGEANAYYESDSRRISLCYELVAITPSVLRRHRDRGGPGGAGEAVAGATLFTLLHELGHALIDLWDLPITGREEDAVDQLATIILLEGEDGQTAALNGADAFWGAEEEDEVRGGQRGAVLLGRALAGRAALLQHRLLELRKRPRGALRPGRRRMAPRGARRRLPGRVLPDVQGLGHAAVAVCEGVGALTPGPSPASGRGV